MAVNLYDLLLVSSNASIGDLRRAYFKLVKEYHPDKHTNSIYADLKFKLINNAYHFLIDPDKRAQYDNEKISFEIDDEGQLKEIVPEEPQPFWCFC